MKSQKQKNSKKETKDSTKTSDSQGTLSELGAGDQNSKLYSEEQMHEIMQKEYKDLINKAIETTGSTEDLIEDEGYRTLFRTVSTDGVTGIFYGNELASLRKFKTPEEAEEYIRKKPWELIITVMTGVADWTCRMREAKKGEQ